MIFLTFFFNVFAFVYRKNENQYHFQGQSQARKLLSNRYFKLYIQPKESKIFNEKIESLDYSIFLFY